MIVQGGDAETLMVFDALVEKYGLEISGEQGDFELKGTPEAIKKFEKDFGIKLSRVPKGESAFF